jgi:hypothetical protein
VVVLDHRGSGALGANVEIDLEDAAQLTVVSIHDWADDAVHVAAHTARLGRDARLKHVVVTLGGDLVRVTATSRFTAPGAELEALGLYFADAGQHQEHRLFVDHAVPHCRSNVTYKGALQGDGAHTVWVGDVLIRAAAEGTDTYELNRNLVLTGRRPRRLRAEPRDRDRRDRRRRPRQRDRPLRRRAAVLPAGPGHPRDRGPPARRARLLRRARAADRRPRHRGAAHARRSRGSWRWPSAQRRPPSVDPRPRPR